MLISMVNMGLPRPVSEQNYGKLRIHEPRNRRALYEVLGHKSQLVALSPGKSYENDRENDVGAFALSFHCTFRARYDLQQ
jgi:hypothetical protein